MKRSQFAGFARAGRGLRVLVTAAVLSAALAVANAVVSPSGAAAAMSVRHGGAEQVFYTTSGAGNGLPICACWARRDFLRSASSRSPPSHLCGWLTGLTASL